MGPEASSKCGASVLRMKWSIRWTPSTIYKIKQKIPDIKKFKKMKLFENLQRWDAIFCRLIVEKGGLVLVNLQNKTKDRRIYKKIKILNLIKNLQRWEVIWAIEVEYWTVSTNNPKMRSSVDLQKKRRKKS
jgi:hypothetical protein